jgi:hypothetical protein
VRRVVGRAELAREEPVSACIWSRPVKIANRFGSVARMRARRSSRMRSASSQLTSTNSPAPRSAPGLRSSGLVRRAGEYCFMMPELPFAQITPC